MSVSGKEGGWGAYIARRELPPCSFWSFSDKVLPLQPQFSLFLVVCIDRLPFSWTESVADLVGMVVDEFLFSAPPPL